MDDMDEIQRTKLQDAFRRVIAKIDPIANSPMTDENMEIKMLADWGRKACDKIDELENS